MHKLIATSALALMTLASLGPRPANSADIPSYRVDPSWPQLPNHWSLGEVAAVAIGRDGHVWLLHRPRTVPSPRQAAAAVLQFDADGHFLSAWGGAGRGYDWPRNEHSLALDADGNLWITGNGAGDDALLKFSPAGNFLLQYGHNGASRGNADHDNLKQAAGMAFFAATHELFIADGYGNRRLIVLDADRVRFKRMWGAFGNVPVDAAQAAPAPQGHEPLRYESHAAPLGDSGRGSEQFALPHAVVVANDGLVYVADRPNRRIQEFTLDGHYLRQAFINRSGPALETACGLALSPDVAQRYLYVADYGNSQILILDRKSLAVLKTFGTRGAGAGQFQGAHSLAVDRNGVLYVTEVAPGDRVQRFLPLSR